MKCPYCGQEIKTSPHVCPSLPPGPPAEFVDVFLTRVTTQVEPGPLQAYLQQLLPHLEPPAISLLLQHLPAVILRNQPRPAAEKIRQEMSLLGATVLLKAVSPTRPLAPRPGLPLMEPPPPPRRFTLGYLVLLLACALAGLAYFLVSRQPSRPESEPEPITFASPRPDPGLKPVDASPPKLKESAEDPAQVQIRSLLQEGVKQYNQSRYIEAIHTMEQALLLDPKQPQALNNLAVIYCTLGWDSWKKNDFDNAKDLFQEAMHYQPEALCALRGLGFTYFRQDDLETALAWLNRYFDLGGDQADVYALISDIYYRQNDLKKAMEFLRMALALDPSQAAWKDRLNKLEREHTVEKDFLAGDTRHFVVKYEGYANAEAGWLVMTLLEEAYLRVGAELHYYPPNPITAILYTDRQFQDITRVPAWAGAAYDGKIRVPAKGLRQDDERLQRIIFHEYTHAVVHEWSRGRAPTWLHEGLAQTLEGEPTEEYFAFARLLARSDQLIPLRQLEGPFIRLPEPQAKVAYAESRLALEFLEQTYGSYVIRQLMEALAEGKTMDQTLQDATYLNYDQFNRRLLEWVGQSYGSQ